MNFGGFYSRITELQRRLETIPDAIAVCVEYNKEEILSLRKDGILSGRDSKGNLFQSYSSDPYLDTEEARRKFGGRQAYLDRKHRLEGLHHARIEHPLGYPVKPSDTPNLRYTSKRWRPGENFQDSMFIRVTKNEFIIGSDYGDADEISAKYNGLVYDPGPEEVKYFWKWLLFPWLNNHLRGQ